MSKWIFWVCWLQVKGVYMKWWQWSRRDRHLSIWECCWYINSSAWTHALVWNYSKFLPCDERKTKSMGFNLWKKNFPWRNITCICAIQIALLTLFSQVKSVKSPSLCFLDFITSKNSLSFPSIAPSPLATSLPLSLLYLISSVSSSPKCLCCFPPFPSLTLCIWFLPSSPHVLSTFITLSVMFLSPPPSLPAPLPPSLLVFLFLLLLAVLAILGVLLSS